MTKCDRIRRLFGAVLAAAPFAFGAIRLLQTGSDVRLLWMACSAFVGASAALAFARAGAMTATKSFGLALGVATLGAVWTALLLGASAAPGIWAVGCGFGLFNAGYVWSRNTPKPRPAVPATRSLSYRDGARLLAAGEFALLLPAAFFLAAVVVRSVPGIADAAQQVVMWYADRLWTLWVLLIALPFAALISGCATLLGNPDTLEWRFSASTGLRRVIATETVTAGVILTVVMLHMLAN